MYGLQDVSFIFALVFFASILFPDVYAYYCNHDLCRVDQYCCGDNLCCDYVYSLWYFWIGVVFLVIVLSVCGGFFRYCYDSNSYVIVQTWKTDYYPTQELDDNEKNLNSSVVHMDAPPPYPGTNYANAYDKDSYENCYTSGSSHSAFSNQQGSNILVQFN